MAFSKLTEKIDAISTNVQQVSKDTVAYYKLDVFKKSMLGATSMARYAVIGLIALIMILFVSVAASISIGEAIENIALGYLIVAGFYFLLLILAMLFLRKPLEKFIITNASRKYFNDNGDKNI